MSIFHPIKIFGNPDESFAQTLILYHAAKTSIDSQALAYHYTNRTHGGGGSPPDLSGYVEDYTNIPDGKELAFEFFLPVNKGDSYSVWGEMVDWDDPGRVVGVLYNDYDNQTGKRSRKDSIFFKAEYKDNDPVLESNEVFLKFKDANINHGYCRMLFVGFKNETETAKLNETLDTDLTGRGEKRYLLRIRTRVDSNYPRGAVHYREDSLLLVIKKKSV